MRRIVIKLLFLRGETDPKMYLRLKGMLQTEPVYEAAMKVRLGGAVLRCAYCR